jgi:hypothetical protein
MSRFLSTEIGNEELGSIGAYWQQSVVSLEEALAPVMSRFDQLDRSIKESKKRCNYPSTHNLTRDESAAVFLYTMEGGDNSFYLILNETLRSKNRRAAKLWFGFLKLFDSALNKLPTVRKSIWRGMNGDCSHLFKKDEILTWWSISSCSISLTAAQHFLESKAHGTLLMIEAKNAKDITGYTNFPDEKEVILKPGTYLRVEDNALRHPGGLNVIHLLELDDDEAQAEKEKIKTTLVSESGDKGTTGTYYISLLVIKNIRLNHRETFLKDIAALKTIK